MADEQIEIPVLVKAKPDPHGTVWGIGRFTGVFGRAFSAIQRHPVVLGLTALFGLVTKAISAQRTQEAAVNALNQSLIQQGVYSRALSQQYQDMASAIQSDTAFGDEAVIDAQATLQAYLKDKTISEELMRAVVDFAAGNRMSLAAAADAVGKTIGSSTNALARYGVNIDQTLSPQEKLAAVTRSLNARWGGQAAASADGLGAITQMQNALGDLLEVVGRVFQPFVVMLAKEVAAFARALQSSQPFMNALDHASAGFEIGISIVKTSLLGMVAAAPGAFRMGLKFAMAAIKSNLLDATEIMTSAGERGMEIAKQQGRSAIRAAQRNREQRSSAAAQKEAHNVSESLRRQGELTDTRRLELNKRESKEDALRKAQINLFEKQNTLQFLSDREQVNVMKNSLSHLAELKNSKFGPQVLIGKAASVAQITANTAIAITGAIEATAAIPPPVGEALGQALAAFLGLYGAEQINNIVDSTIDNPGRIGEVQFSFEDILDSIWGYLGDVNATLGRLVGEILGQTGGLIKDVSAKIGDALSELGIFGEITGGALKIWGDITGSVYEAVASVVEDVLVFVGGIMKEIAQFVVDIIATVVNAIVDVVEAFAEAVEDIFDFLFGWLFAEGGVVTHTGTQPVVTPLKESGLRLQARVDVKIVGGLVASRQEARRLAVLIAREMR